MRDDPFVTHRSLLFTVAYEMLGSATDAEDVVQETWLRWADVDRAEVRDPRAYLVRIVTRQALNRLRTLARRREEYVGEWLPEPLPTSPDVAEDVELAESVSIAMLRVLETLAPSERAVFVLREVFDLPYAEIALAVDKTPGAVRQIAHRAREHVAARRPRIDVDRTEHQQVVDRFLAAVRTGDLQVLLDVLAPEVVLVADGGGEVAAFRLIWRAHYDHPDIPDSIAILGCDDTGDLRNPGGGCSLHYFDQRGVTRLYHLSAEAGVWRFWRDSPGFSQRFAGTLSPDGWTVDGVAELCSDGSTWDEDLRITYKRVK
jgi:RNA polymerase sigma factor (sigma-70 family)